MSLDRLQNFDLRDGLQVVGANAMALWTLNNFGPTVLKTLGVTSAGVAWVVSLMVLAVGNFIGAVVTDAILNAVLGRR